VFWKSGEAQYPRNSFLQNQALRGVAEYFNRLLGVHWFHSHPGMGHSLRSAGRAARISVMSQLLTIPYPDTLPDDLNLSRQEFEGEARLALAAKWYEMGRLSSAQAAQMAGLERVPFLMALQKLGVSFFNLDEDELTRELTFAREAFAGRQ